MESKSTATTVSTNYGALSTLIIVFFFWGFIAAGNNVFIPFCKSYFHLDQFQSMLIDFAFYTAYYFGALFLFAMGSLSGMDLVGKWGYKLSIVRGLLFSTLGAIAMIIAVESNTFNGMLIGLFMVALGFSLQQTAAQPFAISLGDPATGASRVNLCGGINSFGTTIGPLLVALALYGTTKVSDDLIQSLSLNKVVVLYSVVGALFLIAAAIFYFSKKVPASKMEEVTERSNKALYLLIAMTILLLCCFVPVFMSYRQEVLDQHNTAMLKDQLEMNRMYWLLGALVVIIGCLAFAGSKAIKKPLGWGAMKYPQLILGMIAIFVYVGVEVGVGSNLSELLKQDLFGGLSTSEVTPYVSMYWGSIMIGRWTGAVAAFNISESKKNILKFIAPLLAFGVILLAGELAGYDMSMMYYYIICVLLQAVASFFTNDKPILTLLTFGLLGVFSTVLALNTTGMVAVYALLACGLCCSIMWPCIFTLALSGLGNYTTQGSAFLIMMILGGGIIPPIQGKLADIIGIHHSYIVAALCFVYITAFAFAVKKILSKQGIQLQ